MSTHNQDAARLIDLYDEMWGVNNVNARRAQEDTLTGDHVREAIAAGDRLEQACEVFRRRHYPRAGRVICALGMVSTLSPKGRRGRVVFEAREDGDEGASRDD